MYNLCSCYFAPKTKKKKHLYAHTLIIFKIFSCNLTAGFQINVQVYTNCIYLINKNVAQVYCQPSIESKKKCPCFTFLFAIVFETLFVSILKVLTIYLNIKRKNHLLQIFKASLDNRLFPSYPLPLFQNESMCETIQSWLAVSAYMYIVHVCLHVLTSRPRIQ